MQYTENQIKRLIDKHEALLNAVSDYCDEKFPKERHGETRIVNDCIQERINTSCHCHPEYEWVERGTLEDFSEWVRSKGERYTTKYYQKY